MGTEEYPPGGDGWGRTGPDVLRRWGKDECGDESGHAAAVLESGPSASDPGGWARGGVWGGTRDI